MSPDLAETPNGQDFGPEKRKEPRRSAGGEVNFVVEESHAEVRGRLVDISAHGFRASHEHAGLRHGQVVAFRHPIASGRARVVWNRIAGANVETGFVVI